MAGSVSVAFGGLAADGTAGLQQLVDDRVASGIFAHDASLWGPAAAEEAAIRLGWTDVQDRAAQLIPQVEELRGRLTEAGVDRIVLCGMGGSSLAPEVIARWAGVSSERFTMLDSTHPDAVRRALDPALLPRTAVVVSSKSGGTIETRSHLATFEAAFQDTGIDPLERVVIVTDPGSPLDTESRERGRHVFNADPNVGGRFSALTAFGIVPTVLAGIDTAALVEEAVAVRDELAADSVENPALRLAAAIAAGLPQRFVLIAKSEADASWGFGAWIEQLVAESTGKDGIGVLPIALDADAPEFATVPPSALPVRISSSTSAEATDADGVVTCGTLGGQMLLWEVATSALGRLMGIDPFNQPDVEAAKVAARAALAAGPADASSAPKTVAAEDLVEALRAVVPADGYLTIQAYVDMHGVQPPELEALRTALATELGVPVALEYGPRFLHSVGQLHKGGPAKAAFLQVTDVPTADLPIPESDSTFGELIAAQSRGDREVLLDRGRPVVNLEL